MQRLVPVFCIHLGHLMPLVAGCIFQSGPDTTSTGTVSEGIDEVRLMRRSASPRRSCVRRKWIEIAAFIDKYA